MRISLNWLQDYLSYDDVNVDEISSILTSIGLEVEGVVRFEPIKGGLKDFFIGEVVLCEKHPNADRLKLTEVDLGANLGLKTIVCGAPNVASGQKVVVATEGAVIYTSSGESFTIKKSKIRGEESNGMICAEDELGLGDDHDGIMVLDNSAVPGMRAADFFNIETDTIFEIGLTPNRTDAMHHKGVARDLAIAMRSRGIGCEFNPEGGLNLPKVDHGSKEKLVIESMTNQAPKFGGSVIRNIDDHNSPEWLKRRLNSIGESPKNVLVDVTNYILHDLGQPLHAYDLSKIEGSTIKVKEVQIEEELEALNGTKLKLKKGDIVICDSSKIIGVAGVMGTMNSAIDQNTNSIFLEGAYFDPVSIRRSSQRLGLRSEAAMKFEKGIDPNAIEDAIQKAIRILSLSNRDLKSSEIEISSSQDFPFWTTILTRKNLDIYSNIHIADENVESILKGLGIAIDSKSNGIWNLRIPRFKEDVRREEDVIEEVLRIYGYDRLPYPKYLRSNLSFSKGRSFHQFETSIVDFMTGHGFQEIITNSISQSKYYGTRNLIRLLNSMTSELNCMRLTMLPSILEVMEHNVNRGNSDLMIFELGNIYSQNGNGNYKLEKRLSIAISGSREKPNWKNTEGLPNDYFYIKSVIESLAKRWGWKFSYDKLENKDWHYGLAIKLNQKVIGAFGEAKFEKTMFDDLSQKVFYADIDLDYLYSQYQRSKVSFQEVSKFLSVKRDLAIVIDDAISFAEIEALCYKTIGSVLIGLTLFDIYKDKSLGQNKKSYAIRFQLTNRDKTMSDKEIDSILQRLLGKLQKQFKAEIRS